MPIALYNDDTPANASQIPDDYLPANRKELNLSGYKVIKNRQFGYVTITSRNGQKISIALLNGHD